MKFFLSERFFFFVCLLISIVLIVSGFIVPPTGVIDGSVLTATGILFAFAALSKVDTLVSKGYDARLTHGSTSFEVTNGEQESFPILENTENVE